MKLTYKVLNNYCQEIIHQVEFIQKQIDKITSQDNDKKLIDIKHDLFNIAEYDINHLKKLIEGRFLSICCCDNIDK